MAEFARQPYEGLIGRTHEREIPFTAVAKAFRGDRYGEFSDTIPPDADYAAQVPSERERAFTWFLPGRAPPSPAVQSVRWDFCAGDAPAALLDGWSPPEPRHNWMVGAESTLALPALRGDGDAVLRLRVTPHVFGDVLTQPASIADAEWTQAAGVPRDAGGGAGMRRAGRVARPPGWRCLAPDPSRRRRALRSVARHFRYAPPRREC